ncbi:MAG: phenylacetate--CoA ligase family protein [Rhizobiaceae bacterium]
MAEYFDCDEISDPAERQKALFGRLPDFLAEISSNVPAWKNRLAGVNLKSINSPDNLATLPVLRKSELMSAQAEDPPFGGYADANLLNGTRVFMSPGPIWEPQPPGIDPWQVARAFFAAGIRPGDLVHNALSYHMTPGGFMLDEGVRALGANVFPAGTGNTEQQVSSAAKIRPDAYAGTPDYLKMLLDKAGEMGCDLSSIKKALVSGGALFPSMREEYRKRGVSVMQAFATAEIGVIAYETANDGQPLPGMVCNENLIIEIVRPGTGEPVQAGEVGELVVTSFNRAYPFIRLGTGDLSAILDEPSPCGRTNIRIKGWMGRADQRTKVKGMFVDPAQIEEIKKTVPGIAGARLVVYRDGDSDAMNLQVRVEQGTAPDLQEIADTLASVTKLKGSVELVSELPNDGKIIDDSRDYSS